VNLLPTISVITVCYNAEHLLKKTIESVIEQSYENIEYIIVDGASKDNTRQLVGTYGNKIHQFISEPDSGLYDAMNKGISKATGDLVIFLNAGDYYVSSNVLEYALSKIHYSRADVFFGRYIWEYPPTKDIVLSDNSFVVYEWNLKHSNFPHPATFYKRETLMKVGFFDETYRIMADYEWNVKALVKLKVPFQYIDIITVKFTADGISTSAANRDVIQSETDKINKEYYHPKWIFDFVEKYAEKQTWSMNLAKKVLGKFYNKRLNKIY